MPVYIGGDAEIEKLKDPIVKHFAKKGKKASNANIIKAASILGYKDAKNVSKWDTKRRMQWSRSFRHLDSPRVE